MLAICTNKTQDHRRQRIKNRKSNRITKIQDNKKHRLTKVTGSQNTINTRDQRKNRIRHSLITKDRLTKEQDQKWHGLTKAFSKHKKKSFTWKVGKPISKQMLKAKL